MRDENQVLELSLNEIRNGKHFEELVSAYFEGLAKDLDHVTEVKVEDSGEGPDGGVDILVTYRYSDDIKIFERKWIIQCKFYNRSVSTSHISDINIPSLISSKGADGYLLVCKSNASVKLKTFFKELNENCPHGYKYQSWDGVKLLRRINVKPDLIELFFPNYHNSIK